MDETRTNTEEWRRDSRIASSSIKAQDALESLLDQGQSPEDLHELVEHAIQEWKDQNPA